MNVSGEIEVVDLVLGDYKFIEIKVLIGYELDVILVIFIIEFN